jgi:hypothetical protein
MPNLVELFLYGNLITAMHADTFLTLTSLTQLEIFDNLIGCVHGVSEDAKIDEYALQYGLYKTPRCLSNCSINMFYDMDACACLHCPTGTYTAGVYAVNCTAVAATTTLSVLGPTCYGDMSPFSVGDKTLCVPHQFYPASNVSRCFFDKTWEDLKSMRGLFKTGGLGDLMIEHHWEVWVCPIQHVCGMHGDLVCFSYSEIYSVFVPWGYNCQLDLVKR